jgi:serine/threonine protein kinase
MGVVYEAEQDQSPSRVALKVLRGNASTFGRRILEREAQVLAQLQHSGIARFYGTGEEGEEDRCQPYLILELVQGEQLLRAALSRSLDLEQRLRVFLRICRAVHHAHVRGIVHRDLKPDNILVTRSGQPKILDFGIALATGMQEIPLLSQQNQRPGTLPYMSPEQAIVAGRALDHRSDLYALGVILYELLTGQLPYAIHGRSVEDALQVIAEVPPLPLAVRRPHLPQALHGLVARCLQKSPRKRHASALLLVRDLQRVLRNLTRKERDVIPPGDREVS